MSWPELPVIPSIRLPEPVEIGPPVLDIPKAKLPSYKAIYVPPSDLRPPPGVPPVKERQEQTTTQQTKPQTPELPPEAQLVQVPFTDVEIPMPTTTIMTTAATTAFISVGATLVGQSIFKYLVMIFKPVLKQTWTRLTKKKSISPKAP
nr:uncharacterized protein [uncultured Mediterranean phage uvMED]